MKEIAVGGTVEMLLEHRGKYSPMLYLNSLSINQASPDKKTIARIWRIDADLSNKIDELNKALLLLDQDKVPGLCGQALEILGEYGKAVQLLKGDSAGQANSLYKDWNLKWMLEYIRDASMEYDEIYAQDHRLDLTKEAEYKVKDLRDYYDIECPGEDVD